MTFRFMIVMWAEICEMTWITSMCVLSPVMMFTVCALYAVYQHRYACCVLFTSVLVYSAHISINTVFTLHWAVHRAHPTWNNRNALFTPPTEPPAFESAQKSSPLHNLFVQDCGTLEMTFIFQSVKKATMFMAILEISQIFLEITCLGMICRIQKDS